MKEEHTNKPGSNLLRVWQLSTSRGAMTLSGQQMVQALNFLGNGARTVGTSSSFFK